jgi:predicted secreted acid phosphatase
MKGHLRLLVGVSLGICFNGCLHACEVSSYSNGEQGENDDLFSEPIKYNSLATYYSQYQPNNEIKMVRDEYEKMLNEMETSAYKHFNTFTITPKDIVIFDIDDTALLTQRSAKCLYFELTSFLPAIPQMLELYKFITAWTRQIKVFFISSRTDCLDVNQFANKDKAIENLGAAGFVGIEESRVILMPLDIRREILKNAMPLHESQRLDFVKQKDAEWKKEKRRNLHAAGYRIIANFDDHIENLDTDEKGVLLPGNFQVPKAEDAYYRVHFH